MMKGLSFKVYTLLTKLASLFHQLRSADILLKKVPLANRGFIGFDGRLKGLSKIRQRWFEGSSILSDLLALEANS